VIGRAGVLAFRPLMTFLALRVFRVFRVFRLVVR
jgi:hypothetical protein